MNIKTNEEIKIMREGGKKLAEIRRKIKSEIKEGVNAMHIEELATRLIEDSGGAPSFKMVPGYFWSTCINVNEGVVHGIPQGGIIFKKADLVSLDLGFFYKGFHTDVADTVIVGHGDSKKEKFLASGKNALKTAISKASVGNKLGMISKAIEDTVGKAGFNLVKALVGHGVGRKLHEEPFIPCYVSGNPVEELVLKEGLVLAIEIIYSQGSGEVITDSDGWTIRTKDAKIAALFEETVAVTENGPSVLTA